MCEAGHRSVGVDEGVVCQDCGLLLDWDEVIRFQQRRPAVLSDRLPEEDWEEANG